MAKIIAFLLTTFFTGALLSQNLTIDGYVFESGNRGFLNVVQVTVFDAEDKELGTTFSDATGHFEISVPARFKYRLNFFKDMFEKIESNLVVESQGTKDKLFTKVEMKRTPGYMFEITLAEKRDHDSVVVDAIKGARIEVYNNTKKEAILVLGSHPDPEFDVALHKGNHYTILVRKDGYLGKRMEAYVDVEGCILCFEGIGSITPGVTDNLSEGNEMGVLLANVELTKIFEGKTIPISNINYKFGKADINDNHREGLQKLATMMNDNPDLTVEIGSHTDSRGNQQNNLLLSIERAKNVVDFLVENGVSKSRLISRGYGEANLLNDCDSFTECSEAKHKVNRRTELKVIGIAAIKAPLKSLAQIKQMEQGEALIAEIQFGGQVQIPLESTMINEDVELDSLSEVVTHTEQEGEVLYEMEDQGLDQGMTDPLNIGVDSSANDTIVDSKWSTSERQEIGQAAIDLDIKAADKGHSADKDNVEVILEEPAQHSKNYKIVIRESIVPLTNDDELFVRHSQLEIFKQKQINYYLIGNFANEMDARSFYKTAKLAYPDCYLVQLIDGELIRK